MSEIIKFPKEISHLKYALSKVTFPEEIIKYKNDIITHARFLEIETLVYLLEAFFNKRDYATVIMINDEYLKQGIKSLAIDLYVLLSYIGLEEIFQGRNYLIHSQALQPYKSLFLEGGANYSHVLGLKDPTLYQNGLTFIIASFIAELANEEIGEPKLYYFARFVDLLNVMHELGFEKSIINKMISIIDTLFKIKL